mgnify:CR=1 FL=1
MIRFKRLLYGLSVLVVVGGASGCVSYPVYDAPPSNVYYVDEPWGCDPFYGPCAPGSRTTCHEASNAPFNHSIVSPSIATTSKRQGGGLAQRSR